MSFPDLSGFPDRPRIVFGAGRITELGDLVSSYGPRCLLITGGSSLQRSGYLDRILDLLKARKVRTGHETVSAEPSPGVVDALVEKNLTCPPDCVAAVGGGSVIDTGKAVSAMLPLAEPVTDYLEGVGKGAPHPGKKLPFIAVPTTAGTGSEATRNAVLSRSGPEGFKKSLRHDNFIPDTALIDPELALLCPPDVTAASGLDALTQLIGAYVSTRATAMTDELCLRAFPLVRDSLLHAVLEEPGDVQARANMAYAALVSGIGLANAGLGVVHGLASPLGAYFPAPHGAVCGKLLAPSLEVNIGTALKDPGVYSACLEKYSRLGTLIAGKDSGSREANCRELVRVINDWTGKLKIPGLGKFGVTEEHLDSIIESASLKNNPVPLDPERIREILRKSL